MPLLLFHFAKKTLVKSEHQIFWSGTFYIFPVTQNLSFYQLVFPYQILKIILQYSDDFFLTDPQLPPPRRGGSSKTAIYRRYQCFDWLDVIYYIFMEQRSKCGHSLLGTHLLSFSIVYRCPSFDGTFSEVGVCTLSYFTYQPRHKREEFQIHPDLTLQYFALTWSCLGNNVGTWTRSNLGVYLYFISVPLLPS